jgi:hypothetical protein
MRVARTLFAAVAVLGLAFSPPTRAAPGVALGNAIFIDSSGAHAAQFSWSGPCNGVGTIILTVSRPSGDDVRTVSATSVMVPDLCGIACLGCPVPFAWILTGTKVALAGGGLVAFEAGAWSLQGSFAEGVLEARAVNPCAACVQIR